MCSLKRNLANVSDEKGSPLSVDRLLRFFQYLGELHADHLGISWGYTFSVSLD